MLFLAIVLQKKANSKKGYFGRKTEFFRGSEDFVGNQETWETQSYEDKISGSLRFDRNCSETISQIPDRDDIPDFQADLLLTRFKQHLFDVSPPVIFASSFLASLKVTF